MWYRLDLRVRADVDDQALHQIGVLANTYAIVDEVLATRDPERGSLASSPGSIPPAQERRSAPCSA